MTDRFDKFVIVVMVAALALAVGLFVTSLADQSRHCHALWANTRTHSDTLIAMADEYCRHAR